MSDTKVITPECRLSYPNLLEPRPNDKGVLFYSVSPIFESGTDLTPIKQIILAAMTEKFGSDAEEMIRNKKVRLPLRTDWEAKGYPEDSVFFSCKSKAKPGIVGLAPGSDGRPAPYEGEIYPGIYARLSVQAYYYPNQGGGIGMGLRNVQILRDGPRLDGAIPAANEFDADENATVAQAGAADLDDLL